MIATAADGGVAPARAQAGTAPARVPSLDGLRAVGILFVIFVHALVSATRGASAPWLLMLWGQIGTSTFFAISGFIITLLLLREHRARGSIDLKAFYLRRAARILPPLWAFVLVSAIVAPWLRPAFSAGDLAPVLLFVVDYAPTGIFWLDHTWSLGATEQFYLLWPVALLATLPGRAATLAWTLLFASPVLRVGAYFLGVPGALAQAFHTIIDAFSLGCLLAILRDRDPAHWLLRLLRRPAVAGLSVVFLLLVNPVLCRSFGGAYFAPVGLTLRCLAVGSILMWATTDEGGPVRRLLNGRVMVHVGAISYSLYLWQQPFFDAAVAATWIGSIPVAVAGSFLMAELSYRLIEVPIVRFRAVRKSRAAATAAAGSVHPA